MTKWLIWWLPDFSNINYFREWTSFQDINISKILKLFNLSDTTDDEIEEEIEKLLDMNLNNSNTLDYINSMYQKSIWLYTNNLLIDLKKPFSNNIFKNKHDVINFLKATTNSKFEWRRQIYCDLIKIMFCFNEVEKYSQMKNAEKNTNDFVADNILESSNSMPWYFKMDLSLIMNKKENKDYYETKWHYFKKIGNGFKRINCTLRYRGKSTEKMVIKMLWNEKWASNILDIIKDSIWIELEADSKEESIYLLEYLYLMHKEKWDIDMSEFRQKASFYSKNDINDFCKQNYIDESFKEDLNRRFKVVKKVNASNKYQDWKVQWLVQVRDREYNGCESRVVIKWNRNQSGMSASEIIDWKKIIDAVVWLRWWVSEKYIQKLSENISNHSNIKKTKEVILEDFLKKLLKVTIPRRKTIKIYSTKWRLKDIIKNAEKYPTFIVQAIKSYFNLTKSLEEIISDVKNNVELLTIE